MDAFKIEKNKDLKEFTSWLVGGPAEHYCAPNNIDELKNAMAFAKKETNNINNTDNPAIVEFSMKTKYRPDGQAVAYPGTQNMSTGGYPAHSAINRATNQKDNTKEHAEYKNHRKKYQREKLVN